jgi:preprotein translocase subunit SecE
MGALCRNARPSAPVVFSAALCRYKFEDVGLMARYNPIEFVNEVRHEVSKVTWPTLREVWITTVLVGIMVVIASLFFLVADQILGTLVKMLLSIGK